jgi:Vanadium chloroperoxidase N-terminal domain
MHASIRKTLLAASIMSSAAPAVANVITDWNENTVSFVTPRMSPGAAQRVVAIVQAAMFDAVNSIERQYEPYLVQLPASAGASKDAAAATAAGTVLAALIPQANRQVRAMMTDYLAAIAGGDAKAEGIKLGEAVAAKILDVRGKDGADAPDAYRYKTKPGVYVPTAITVSSTWDSVTPFALKSASQFRPPPPIPLKSEQWAVDYTEIKDFGGKTSAKRSARQTEDAHFWLITGPQSTEPLVRQVVEAKKLSVIDSARFMALTAMAAADAAIAVFDAKYHYEFWRPITAIRNGDEDENPGTERDATWQPIDNTPMHPEYPCAHCIVSGAVASTIEALQGTPEVAEISMTSPTAPGATHSWTNMRAYNEEVSNARIWAGFHYRFSTRVGQGMGRQIGEYVANTLLRPATVAAAR